MTPASELDRLFAKEKVMKDDFIAPDLGHPFQHCDKPQTIDFVLTQNERSKAASIAVHLMRHRHEANKRDADRELAGLGVVWTDEEQANERS